MEPVDALMGLWNSTLAFLPDLISGVILLIIGLFVGKLVGKAVKHLLEKAKLDYYISETNKPIVSLTDLFSLIVKWWIYLAFIAAAVDAMGIAVLVTWMSRLESFIPSVLGAALIMIVGYVLGEYIKEQVKKAGTLYANVVGKTIFFFVLYVAVALALPVLGVPSGLVGDILLIIVAAIGIGVALALGLGMKDAVAHVSTDYVKKFKPRKKK